MRVGVREVLADIAQRSGTEQRVTQGMQQHVTVGMSQQPKPVWNPHAAKRDVIALAEAVHVVTVADTHRCKTLKISRRRFYRSRVLLECPRHLPIIDTANNHHQSNRSHIGKQRYIVRLIPIYSPEPSHAGRLRRHHQGPRPPLRRDILRWLKEPQRYFSEQHHSLENGVCAGQIDQRAGLSQSTVSAHLATCRKPG